MAKTLNATEANLAAFKGRGGGKLIMYHGWDDPAISALNSVDLLPQGVVGVMGRDSVDAFCAGCTWRRDAALRRRPGDPILLGKRDLRQWRKTRDHSVQVAVEQWVEKGRGAVCDHRDEI